MVSQEDKIKIRECSNVKSARFFRRKRSDGFAYFVDIEFHEYPSGAEKNNIYRILREATGVTPILTSGGLFSRRYSLNPIYKNA